MTNYTKNINNIFYIFVLSHLIFWTLVPSITNHNLPLDTIEALAWGSNLDWGFDKHPPMSAFFPEVFFQIFGSQDWAYYFLSQIFVIISFYYVFKFSKEFFNSNLLGLISVLLIEAIYFYNFTTPEFNVNVCQLPFWSLVVYYSWRIYESDEKIFKISTIITILGIVNVPIIKYSVDWWNTLHQPASINILSKSSIHSSMLFPLLIMTASFALFSLLIFLMKYNTELIKIKNKGLNRL